LADHTWLVPEHATEFARFTPISEAFDLYTVGVKTSQTYLKFSDHPNRAIRSVG
jgi:hypothetical protein